MNPNFGHVKTHYPLFFLWGRPGSSFQQMWRPSKTLYPKKTCTKFVWNWPRGSQEEDKNVKVHTTTDYNNDANNRQKSIEPVAQVT